MLVINKFQQVVSILRSLFMPESAPKNVCRASHSAMFRRQMACISSLAPVSHGTLGNAIFPNSHVTNTKVPFLQKCSVCAYAFCYVCDTKSHSHPHPALDCELKSQSKRNHCPVCLSQTAPLPRTQSEHACVLSSEKPLYQDLRCSSAR